MIKADLYFKQNLKKILDTGHLDKDPRAKYADGTPAHTLFITQVFEEYDLLKGEYPITTLRNTAIKTGIKEIKWIYMAQNNLLSTAKDLGINWWDSWDIGDGTIGQRYGHTVNRYNLYNKLLIGIYQDPFGRRHIMNLWQEQEFLEEPKGLKPCAYETLWSLHKKNDAYYVDMTLNQRSSDYIMAGYINKSQYVALMIHTCHTLWLMSGCKVKYIPNKFCHLVQNLHIYDRHISSAHEIMNREGGYQPTMSFNEETYDFDFTGLEQGKKLSNKLEIAI